MDGEVVRHCDCFHAWALPSFLEECFCLRQRAKEGVASASQVFAIIMEAACRKRWNSNPTGPSPLVTTCHQCSHRPCLSQHRSPRPATLLGVIASQTTPADSLVALRFWETLLVSSLEDLKAMERTGTVWN